MENQFTTTFIPKKPLAQETVSSAPISRPVGLFSTLVTLLFFISLIIAGGVYFFEKYEMNNVAVLAESVKKIEKGFEPQLISELQSLDKQLRNGNLVLKNHVVVSPIFDMLESSAIKQVRFTKFDLVFDDVKGVLVKMSGESDGYPSIAQQSDVLGSNSSLKDTIFSNFFLNQKGRVSFDVAFGVRPDLVDFEKAPLINVQTTAPAGVL
jgi:hypothetical protein